MVGLVATFLTDINLVKLRTAKDHPALDFSPKEVLHVG